MLLSGDPDVVEDVVLSREDIEGSEEHTGGVRIRAGDEVRSDTDASRVSSSLSSLSPLLELESSYWGPKSADLCPEHVATTEPELCTTVEVIGSSTAIST